MTSVITVSDSSDEEIVFFPAEPAKPKQENKSKETKDYGDEVIFCGIKKASSNEVVNLDPVNKKKNRDLVSLSKDVTVSNIGRRKVENTVNNHDPDIEFLGIRKLDNNVASSCSIPRVPAARARSDSFNININSQKSLENTNVTINIDAETNKKKVKLTFLGPSSSNNNNRNRNNALGPNGVKNTNTAFNPVSTSTPRTRNTPLPNIVSSAQPSVNSNYRGTYQPRQNMLKTLTKTTSSYTTIHSNSNNSNATKDSSKPNSNNFIGNMKRNFGNKLNHPPMDSTLNNQNQQKPTNSRIVTASNPTISVRNSESNVVSAIERTVNNLKFDNNADKSQFGEKSSAKSHLLTSNKVQLESQKISTYKKYSNSRENISKSKETSPEISKSKETSPQISKSKETSPQISKSKETSPEISKTKESIEKSSKQSDDKLEKSRNKDCLNSEPVPSTSGVKKFNEMEPIPSTSGVKKKRDTSPMSDSDSSDSSHSTKNDDDDDDDDSSSDSSDYAHIPEPSMTKPALDALFNKFLDNCTKANKGVQVMKMMSKLKKLYLNSQNIACNEEFIIMLKEVSLRMENKSVRDPLDIMKKVFVNLRKDSPTNQKNIQKLEKVLKEINKKIKQFEEAEVTSDEDENDNVYVKLHKYRKRAVEIYNKLCELNSVPADAERPTLRNVSFHGRVPSDFTKSTSVQNLVTRVSRALEKYYNKSHKFPDFHDVRILMGKLSIEGGFKLKPESLQQLARSLFEEFGDMLQKRRLYDEYKVCNEYLGENDEDPYYYDPVLAAKLEENKKMRSKEKDILQRFTLKQATLRESGFSDCASHSSSGGESDEGKGDKKKKATKRNLSESNSDDSDNCDSVSRKTKNNKRQNNASSKSIEGGSDSNEEDTKNEKTKNQKTKKFKKTKSSDGSDNEESRKDLEKSNNKRKRSESTERHLDEPTREKHFKTDKKCQNTPDNTNEINNINLINNIDERASFVGGEYENASTILMDEETERIRSGANSDVVEEMQTNMEIQNDAGDAKEENPVEDDRVVLIEQENDTETQKNNPIDDSAVVVIIDDDSCVPEPETHSVQSEGNIPDKTEVEVDILGSMSSSNTSGLLITDVMTCQESFASDVIVLSDDEEQRPNVLSQEDVLQLIPIIFGKQE